MFSLNIHAERLIGAIGANLLFNPALDFAEFHAAVASSERQTDGVVGQVPFGQRGGVIRRRRLVLAL